MSSTLMVARPPLEVELGFYYPPGMWSSYGPQVGPSTSARYGYENLIMRGIMNLTT
jgi:hypothetical protein